MQPIRVKRHDSIIMHFKMWEALSKQGLSYPQEVKDKYEFIVDYLHNYEIVYPMKKIRQLNARVYERLVYNNERRPNAPVNYLLQDEWVKGKQLDFETIKAEYEKCKNEWSNFEEWLEKGNNENGS